MLRTLITAVLASTAVTATPAVGQSAWRTVGYKTVSGGTDVDRIEVRGNARYRQVRLCVFSAPLRMRDFDVRFENGQRQDVSVRQRIGAGTCTRNIDLAGDRRNIDWVRLHYEPIRRDLTRPLVRVQVR